MIFTITESFFKKLSSTGPGLHIKAFSAIELDYMITKIRNDDQRRSVGA